ncbi:fumarate lyase (plasmid) [Xanthobacter versatilis]|uniref:argininosuccinate lyase n=1 Tax=Xanthobacter autotrophicus (strain ATCC BAA-1158 / Py2) TaxID=78245 RepID=A7IQF5_XANP2|nr:fumarate lyase [Xanthobacter autotrophicus Py2]
MTSPAETSAGAVLEIGNRLSAAPSPQLVTAAFAEEVSGQGPLAPYLHLVEFAHVITLSERGVIPRAPARELVGALLDLHAGGSTGAVAELGDLYTNHEAQVAQRTKAVGWLGTARARREALTTAYHLLVRERLLALGTSLARLGRALAVTALTHADDVMPDYTYLQAAQPTSFGHYVLGFAAPVMRDLERLQSLYGRADLCPAGCGSMNGSVAFQDRAALAQRLGFSGPLAHGRDAMWQADLAIEAMALSVAASVGLDRLAEDLMIFATAEFGLVRLSDRHSRASKILPQKRNPYALAFVRGLANRLIGVAAGVAASGRTPTGQMDNRMQSYGAVPEALDACAKAADLMAEVIGALTFDAARARALLADGACFASDLAERLCLVLGVDFRSAHGLVGRLVTRLEQEGRTLASLSQSELSDACRAYDETLPAVPDGLLAEAFDPKACLEARRDIGGAAPAQVRRQAREFDDTFRHRAQDLAATTHRHAAALSRLVDEARSFAGRAP